jgi:hypothetical protein
VEFRLTYRGPLLATQRDPLGAQTDKRAENKREIRRAFHPQLRRLWDITPFLKTGDTSGPQAIITEQSPTTVTAWGIRSKKEYF